MRDRFECYLTKLLAVPIVLSQLNQSRPVTIAVYDEMIAKNPNLPEDSAPAVITKISEQASNLQGIDLGVQQLDAWQEVKKAKKDEEDERQRKLPDQPEITGGK